jgi:hypothetical protein
MISTGPDIALVAARGLVTAVYFCCEGNTVVLVTCGWYASLLRLRLGSLAACVVRSAERERRTANAVHDFLQSVVLLLLAITSKTREQGMYRQLGTRIRAFLCDFAPCLIAITYLGKPAELEACSGFSLTHTNVEKLHTDASHARV